MRAVIQRVSTANVRIDDAVSGAIGPGLLVLLAVETDDTSADAAWLAGKIVNLRIFPDANGLMNRSVLDADGDVLVVSQFTLLASTRKGNRPSFTRSAPPQLAAPIYESFLRLISALLPRPPQTGRFGADMRVRLENDGPVTIIIDSHLKE